MNEFSISDLEAEFWEAFDKAGGSQKGWRVSRIMVVIKSHHNKATRVFQTIDELRKQEWNKIITIICDQTKQFPCDLFNSTIEINSEVDKNFVKDSAKRFRDLNLSDLIDESTPRAKVIRTDKLLDRERVKADALAADGNFDRQLLKEHQYHDPGCRNYNGFCFIDFDNQHFDISADDQAKWAKTISNEIPGVSVRRPPTKLYNRWASGNGPVTQDSRRSVAYTERQEAQTEQVQQKNHITKMMEWQETISSMRMNKIMEDQMERFMARQQRRDDINTT